VPYRDKDSVPIIDCLGGGLGRTERGGSRLRLGA